MSWPNREPQWFEDRAWVWRHYGIAKLRRGELWEALTMLGFFREQVLGPMLQRRRGRDQRGLRRVEQEGLDPGNRLVSTLAIHDDSSVHAALVASAELYLDLRNDDPPAKLAEGVPQRLMEWWDK